MGAGEIATTVAAWVGATAALVALWLHRGAPAREREARALEAVEAIAEEALRRTEDAHGVHYWPAPSSEIAHTLLRLSGALDQTWHRQEKRIRVRQVRRAWDQLDLLNWSIRMEHPDVHEDDSDKVRDIAGQMVPPLTRFVEAIHRALRR